jgi:rod shape determining protein RodA
VAVHLLEGASRLRSRQERRGMLFALRHLDLPLFGATAALSLVGLVIVYSATREIYPAEPTYYVKRQLVYFFLGACVMLVTTFVDYRKLEHWGYPLYGLIVLSLLAVYAFHTGVSTSLVGDGAAQRWIPLGPIDFQPSELGVLAIIIAVAVYAQRHEDVLGPRRIVGMLVIAAIPMALVYKQPDLGTTIVMGVVVFALLAMAGVRLRYLVLLVAIGTVGVVAAVHVHLLKGYELQRLTSFFEPSKATADEKYNLNQAMTAIGAGGFKGSGLFNGQVTNLGYVPEQYADFIFSAVGEQLGFLGSALVIGLFAVLALRILRAIQVARDTLGRMICTGALAFLVFSVYQNIGMNVGLMPITGIPLPFLSYGGSAIIAFFAMIGLVANVEIRRHLLK